MREFTCRECGEVCESVQSEAEARREYEKTFGRKWRESEVAIICDRCWERGRAEGEIPS